MADLVTTADRGQPPQLAEFHRLTDAIADFEIPRGSPRPKILEAMCVLRNMTKSEVPIGSEITLLDHADEQVRSLKIKL